MFIFTSMQMIQEIIIPIAYFLFFLLIISNKHFFKADSISKKVLLVGFCMKAFCAILYGYVFKNGVLTGDDTWIYFEDGNIAYSALKTNVHTYLKLTIGANDITPVPKYLAFYTHYMRFWFDNSNYFLVRLNALIRPFSFGIYNVHALIFAFLSFIGTYNLYLFFETKLNKKIFLQFVLFGIPSIVFWTSGVHKEALTVFGMGLVLYNIDQILAKKYTVLNFFFLFVGTFFLGFVRLYVLIILFPLVLAMIISQTLIKNKMSAVKVYFLTIGVFCLVAFFIDIFSPSLDLIHEFFVRRTYFLHSLPGNMTFPVVSNVPKSVTDYFLLIWEALSNPFIRPLPSECNGVLPVLACIETWFFLLLIVLLLRTVSIRNLMNNSPAVLAILFGWSTMFLIGLIVNNSGAIVRYRSISIPFILIGLYIAGKENKELTANAP